MTAHPTAEWTAQQLRGAFPWGAAPRYLLRDRDRIFGDDFVEQVKAMGVKEVLSACAFRPAVALAKSIRRTRDQRASEPRSVFAGANPDAYGVCRTHRAFTTPTATSTESGARPCPTSLH